MRVDNLSLNKKKCMLPDLTLVSNSWPSDVYSVITVEPLHLLHLGVSKSLKECTLAYLSSYEEELNPSFPRIM